jgi:hypothetical protein
MECEWRERELEKWKQNWDEVFMDEVKRERGEKERGEKRERGEKCHKMFGDRKG